MAEDTTGAELLDDIEAVFRKYTIQQNDWSYWALALYVVFTHCIEFFDFATRLLLTSAEKRSGKTTTLTILVNLVYRALVTANATTPAIFRSLSDGPRTLCFDEADTIFGTKVKAEQNEDLRGLLNAGFKAGMPTLRVSGPNHDVTEFNTFAPAIMCAIGTLPDTITDRAVNIRLRRRKATESVSGYRIRRDEPGLHDLRERIGEWVSTVSERLEGIEPDNPLEDRAADLWEPLLAVAEVAGGHWPERARQAALQFTAEAAAADTEMSKGVELLSDIRDVLALVRSHEIQSSHLVQLLTSKEEARWAEEGLSPRKLVALLREYDIRPGRMSSGNGRGYKITKFEDVFARYLPVEATEVTEVTGSPVTQGSASVTSQPSVTSSDRSEISDRSTTRENTGNQSLLSLTGASRPGAGIHGCHGCNEGTPTEARINQGVPYCNYCIERGRHQQNGDAA